MSAGALTAKLTKNQPDSRIEKEAETVVIGAGQAGLSVSYHLTKAGYRHIVLERDDVGSSWIHKRWDSFTLVTPNWMVRLPGFAYGGDPDGFLTRAEVVRHLRDYAASFGAPVVRGVEVTEVTMRNGGYSVATSHGDVACRNVVVAAGFFHRPKLPHFAGDISSGAAQLHAAEYRNPRALPPGAVLVVGSGQSGCQIAEELNDAGRRVFLAVGRAGREPRRYRGRDINYWFARMGGFDRGFRNPADPVERYTPNPHCSGKAGGHALNLWRLASQGVTLTGRATGVDAQAIVFADDLMENLANADHASWSLMKAIDEYIETEGLDVPEPDEHNTDDGDVIDRPILNPVDRLHLREAGIGSIIWATGFECDYSWIRVPVLDDRGYPRQDHGVTAFPGLYFCGLHWMYSLGSGLLYGVGGAAAHVAAHLLKRRTEALAHSFGGQGETVAAAAHT